MDVGAEEQHLAGSSSFFLWVKFGTQTFRSHIMVSHTSHTTFPFFHDKMPQDSLRWLNAVLVLTDKTQNIIVIFSNNNNR